MTLYRPRPLRVSRTIWMTSYINMCHNCSKGKIACRSFFFIPCRTSIWFHLILKTSKETFSEKMWKKLFLLFLHSLIWETTWSRSILRDAPQMCPIDQVLISPIWWQTMQKALSLYVNTTECVFRLTHLSDYIWVNFDVTFESSIVFLRQPEE